MYYFFKIYMYYEKDIGDPWCCLGPTMIKEYFRPPTMFSLKEMKIHRFAIVSFKKKLFHILVMYSVGKILFNNVLDLSITSMVGFYSISIIHWAYVLLMLPLLSFYAKNHSLHCVVVVKIYFSLHHSLVR